MVAEAFPIAQLLPMSLQLDAGGGIVRAGATLRPLIRNARHFDEAFTIERPCDLQGHDGMLCHLDGRTRLFLRLRAFPGTVLRGQGVASKVGGSLLNLGFGAGLVSAVRNFCLTDADFAPSELAMELLFLHEANTAVQRELASFSSQIDAARRMAEQQAYTDPLTGLDNRRGLELAMRHLTERHAGRPFAIMNIDLDYFKQVNDRWGHAVGDQVLRRVATGLREQTRAGDTISRIGGDEFVLILPLGNRKMDLPGLAKRIISRIEQPIRVGVATARISASIGISESQFYSSPDPGQMLADADAALYAAKAAGRGRAVLHGQPEVELPLAAPVDLNELPYLSSTAPGAAQDSDPVVASDLFDQNAAISMVQHRLGQSGEG